MTATDPLAPLLDRRRGRARFAVPRREPVALTPVGTLLAGAAELDITPPPGLPKAGYSSNAHDGIGFRTRLRARVLHLRTDDASLAIVACDLLGGSAVLQHVVAHRIARTTDVGLSGLMIGATHTHAGPGQFLGTDFYNRFASNRSGFDPAWTGFLADRITAAVERAVADRRPALLASGELDVWGLTRNRSLGPHVRNPEVLDRRTDPQRLYANVNPALHMIRVDSAATDGRATEPLAALIVFSVHGTGIPMKVHEYNADLWAYLVGEASDQIAAQEGHRPVVGAIEGTHADVAPALRPGMAGHVEARRVGRAIGAAAADLHRSLQPHLRAEVALGTALREVDLDRSSSIDDIDLPDRPAVGAALVAGAHENTTPLLHHIPPFKAGSPKRWGRDSDHGPKWVLGSRWLQPIVLPRRHFPRVLPLQVLRIGERALVGIPFEVTVASGRRLAAAAAEALSGVGVRDAIVSSVANEYSGYVASPHEYELQHYEGGHTLYGPHTLGFLAAHVGRLAAELASETEGVGPSAVTDAAGERRFDLKLHRYLPEAPDDDPTTVARRFEGTARFSDTTARHDAWWELTFVDVAPGALPWHESLVRVERRDEDGPWEPATAASGRPIDDTGWDVSIDHRGPVGDGPEHRYVVRWHLPDLRAGRSHRVVLTPVAGRPEVHSPPFD